MGCCLKLFKIESMGMEISILGMFDMFWSKCMPLDSRCNLLMLDILWLI